MNWYLDNGKESDVVVSSRICLVRNLKDYSFKPKMTDKQTKELIDKISFVTPSIGYGLKFIKLEDLDDITKLSLVEKHIIDSEMLSEKNKKDCAILINDEENICIEINLKDHIRIQVFDTGLDLQNTMKLAKEIDEKLDDILHFASNNEFGYLTVSPLDTGTGLKASVIVHLPALKITGNASKVLHIVNNFGMNIKGIFGEEGQVKGDMYNISNNQTLGITEDEIINNLDNITKKVIEQERTARNYLTKNRIDLEDRVYRAYGLLSNAVKLTSDECISLLSDVKLGTDLGIITQLNDKKIKELELNTKPANLQKYLGEILNAYDRQIKRSEVVKQIINSK